MARLTCARDFSEPCPWGSSPLGRGTLANGSIGRSTKTFNRRFEPRKTNFDWLSRDEAEIRKYVYDPLAGFPLTAQAWFDFLHGKSDLGSDDHVDRIPKTLPIHVISGTHDPVGEDGEGVKRLLTLYQGERADDFVAALP